MSELGYHLATDSLSLRIRPEDRALFDRAAQARGMNRTQFVLESARRAATQTVLDQTVLECDDDAWDAFVARLDAPAAPAPALVATMTAPTPWQ